MIVSYATREDLLQLLGAVPFTVRAIVVKDGSDVYGVAGIARMGDHLQAFSQFSEALRPHKWVMAKAGVMFARLLSEYTGAIFAMCSDVEPTSPALLARLGFVPVHERLWRRG